MHRGGERKFGVLPLTLKNSIIILMKMNDAKKYQHPHGITPPLKNVRRRRFRKTAKQKYVDAPEIEKEVKRLLRADVSAVDVNFDVINDEQVLLESYY